MNSRSRRFNREWLQGLLEQTFSDKCEYHVSKRDAYCFDCKQPLCWLCTVNGTVHTAHNHIAIQLHKAQNHLTTTDVQRFNLIDISDVNYHQSGGSILVLLHANQNSSRVGADSQRCQNCHARLVKPNARYCSLACKVSLTNPESEIGSSVQIGSTPDQPIDLTTENADPPTSAPKRRRMSS